MSPHLPSLALMALIGLPCAYVLTQPRAKEQSFPVQVRVDASQSLGPMPEVWRFFGADEPNYATMANGKKLLGELGELKKDHVFFRTHNLLTSGDGKPALKWGSTNAYTEDAAGNPVYDWKILDEIFDTYRKQHVRPYVQIGFMPEALSIHPSPYRHHWTPTARYDEIYTGWTYPPKNYAKWEELAYQWTKHCVERYGRHEVEQWYWEVWNEPNIGYWHGSKEEFWKLHDYAVAGVQRALPTARVGGPDTAGGGAYFRDFIDHCLHGHNEATGGKGSQLDFVSFHAKGAPVYVDGHVRMGIAAQLRTIDENFGIVASFPELKGVPIVIGESDPEGCAACQGPSFGYRNGTVYSSYTAAVFARKLDLASKHGVNLEGALTWAFTFEDQPYFAGFRQLATRGIDLPVMNVFRMFSMMQGDRVSASSSGQMPLEAITRNGVRANADVGAIAVRHGKKLAVMLWHYHDDDIAGQDAETTVELAGLSLADGTTHVTEYRIDQSHSNSYAAWQKMGSPAAPSAEQIASLVRAGMLETTAPASQLLTVVNHSAKLTIHLPRQAVSLVVVG